MKSLTLHQYEMALRTKEHHCITVWLSQEDFWVFDYYGGGAPFLPDVGDLVEINIERDPNEPAVSQSFLVVKRLFRYYDGPNNIETGDSLIMIEDEDGDLQPGVSNPKLNLGWSHASECQLIVDLLPE